MELHRKGVDAEASVGFDELLVEPRGDPVAQDLGQHRQRRHIRVEAVGDVPGQGQAPELSRATHLESPFTALLALVAGPVLGDGFIRIHPRPEIAPPRMPGT